MGAAEQEGVLQSASSGEGEKEEKEKQELLLVVIVVIARGALQQGIRTPLGTRHRSRASLVVNVVDALDERIILLRRAKDEMEQSFFSSQCLLAVLANRYQCHSNLLFSKYIEIVELMSIVYAAVCTLMKEAEEYGYSSSALQSSAIFFNGLPWKTAALSASRRERVTHVF